MWLKDFIKTSIDTIVIVENYGNEEIGRIIWKDKERKPRGYRSDFDDLCVDAIRTVTTYNNEHFNNGAIVVKVHLGRVRSRN